jgi:hypothetical protein
MEISDPSNHPWLDLTKFIDAPPPESSVRTTTGHIEINQSYLPWYRQDQLLLGWLRSSLTETLLAQVISSSTIREF